LSYAAYEEAFPVDEVIFVMVGGGFLYFFWRSGEDNTGIDPLVIVKDGDITVFGRNPKPSQGERARDGVEEGRQSECNE
jgi:hypothetical protein